MVSLVVCWYDIISCAGVVKLLNNTDTVTIYRGTVRPLDRLANRSVVINPTVFSLKKFPVVTIQISRRHYTRRAGRTDNRTNRPSCEIIKQSSDFRSSRSYKWHLHHGVDCLAARGLTLDCIIAAASMETKGCRRGSPGRAVDANSLPSKNQAACFRKQTHFWNLFKHRRRLLFRVNAIEFKRWVGSVN